MVVHAPRAPASFLFTVAVTCEPLPVIEAAILESTEEGMAPALPPAMSQLPLTLPTVMAVLLTWEAGRQAVTAAVLTLDPGVARASAGFAWEYLPAQRMILLTATPLPLLLLLLLLLLQAP